MNKIYFILFLFLIIINLLLFFRKVKENFEIVDVLPDFLNRPTPTPTPTTTSDPSIKCSSDLLDPRFLKDYIVIKNPQPGEDYENVIINYKVKDVVDTQTETSNKIYREIDLNKVKPTQTYTNASGQKVNQNVNYCREDKYASIIITDNDLSYDAIKSDAIALCEKQEKCNFISVFPKQRKYWLYEKCTDLKYNDQNLASSGNAEMKTYQKIKYTNQKSKCGSDSSSISTGDIGVKTDDDLQNECSEDPKCNYIYKDYSINFGGNSPTYEQYKICKNTTVINPPTTINYCDEYYNNIETLLSSSTIDKKGCTGYNETDNTWVNKTQWATLLNSLDDSKKYKTSNNDEVNTNEDPLPQFNKTTWWDNTTGKNTLFIKNQYQYNDGSNVYPNPSDDGYDFNAPYQKTLSDLIGSQSSSSSVS